MDAQLRAVLKANEALVAEARKDSDLLSRHCPVGTSEELDRYDKALIRRAALVREKVMADVALVVRNAYLAKLKE